MEGRQSNGNGREKIEGEREKRRWKGRGDQLRGEEREEIRKKRGERAGGKGGETG